MSRPQIGDYVENLTESTGWSGIVHAVSECGGSVKVLIVHASPGPAGRVPGDIVESRPEWLRVLFPAEERENWPVTIDGSPL